MYDLLIVGAGITAATLAAKLKHRMRICVIDCRDHLGGNCFDYALDGTLIHRYGPHIFHCPSPRIVSFLNAYTQWVPYTHRVIAEIRQGQNLCHVPFPYCRETIRQLGHELSPAEILNAFFRGYSQKMWGLTWEDLPASVRGRIPTELTETPTYYRDRFVALPQLGYTHMMNNMFDGVEIILGAPAAEWSRIKAARIVYTGRPDLIALPGESVTAGEQLDLCLDFRTLDIAFTRDQWHLPSVSLHCCTLDQPWTRKTCFARMTGGNSLMVSTETPRQAAWQELTPYYPIERSGNQHRYQTLAQKLAQHYPHLCLAGRLGTYRYFDMYQAVGQALTLAGKLMSSGVSFPVQ